MMSEKLKSARDYVAAHLPSIPREVFPFYHVTGGVGWINDPNGFSEYKGEYHLFYQYHPYDKNWGPMHWGHVKTKDFLRWEWLPVAMAPDQEYDGKGCFSGSALEMPDGRHLLVYTGVRKDTRPDASVDEYQTQCLAFGDGVEYEKYPFNPVIDGKDLPAGGSVRDFRDPKIWREDGKYYLVAGNRTEDGSGAILLYESDDAFSWNLLGPIAASGNRHGRMWECPDFFALDGKYVLLVSPQEMSARGLEYIDGNGTICFIGDFDREAVKLLPEHEQAIDYGLDFYAPQTLRTSDGRRIMIAWMQYWDSISCQPTDLPFFGQMTVPRELRVREGRLIQNPVRELASCRVRPVLHRDVILSGERELTDLRGRCLDMTVTVRPEAEPYREFRMTVARSAEYGTVIRYRPSEGTVRVDRSGSGYPADVVNVRSFPVRDRAGEIRLRVLLDRYSLELFVNDGEQAASFTLYTDGSADGVAFAAEGTLRMDVEKYDLEF